MPRKDSKTTSYRGYADRKVATRELNERFLIICEGDKTEPNYFKSFRVPKDVIDVRGLGANPSKLVEKAKELKAQGDYDQVWCVFDRDDWPKQDFNNAIANAEREGFKVAYSNEAFELWYVLHFEFLNTGLPRKDYSAKLDKFLQKKYQKNSSTIYEEIEIRQATAIKHAKNLLKQYDPPNPESDNPSTTVHYLVEELNKFIR
ncbi:RloB domain-containing protein [Nostoc sp. FACHB-87]|uniref:RloB family protein n=1 Tax=Nostocaceae TaxID=1162 RepID=UPI00168305D2|nr:MULTISPECIES: RloB family protein [Nostocaceae]MBD2454679.1 RloB domain-containing protein [Nostoc sp. FACHB-87]MBD2475902.1 RloB domain-containing protein [Anabaena sp. FACHB-83]